MQRFFFYRIIYLRLDGALDIIEFIFLTLYMNKLNPRQVKYQSLEPVHYSELSAFPVLC